MNLYDIIANDPILKKKLPMILSILSIPKPNILSLFYVAVWIPVS